MAIPHFSVKNGSRSKGKSAGAHFTYLVREGRYHKSHFDLEFVRHENYPEWARENPLLFWDAADLYERANGRTYTEFEIALPRELSRDERITLVGGFLEEHLGTRHPYTVVIHNPVALDGKRQPHAHVIFTERRLDGVERPSETFFSRANKKHPEKGGAAKDRDLHRREKVAEFRNSWEQFANKALARAGVRERVDLRSLKAQGIDRSPEPKLGQSRTVLYRKGIVTEAAQEMMQIRLVAHMDKERGQVRRELGRAKIAQYKENRQEKTVEVKASEVLKMVKKAKRDLYDKIERSEKSQYELGGFKSRGVQEIRFHNTTDPFIKERRAALVTRHTQYEHDLSELKKYEKELLLVGEQTLEVRQKGNWTKKSAVVMEREFDNAVERAQEQQRELSIEQGKGLELSMKKEKNYL